MRALTTDLYIAKRPFKYCGKSVEPGEIVEPAGGARDSLLFGDNTHWFTRIIPVVGREPLECTSDGCGRKFATLGALHRHQQIVHAPEREDRLRFQREHREMLEAREQRGETIGGYEVDKTVDTGRGKVPYVKI